MFIKRFADRTQNAKRKESIFISYCHSVDTECICDLGAQLEKLGYLIVIDRLVRPFDDFSAFMETIRNNDYVICVINDDYLRSFSCMTEITAFMHEQNYRDRLLPINAGNDCFNWQVGATYKAYWKLAQEKNIDNIEAKYNKCVDVNLKISEFLTFVQAINSPSIYNMSQTVQWISEKLLNDARANQ